MRRAKHARATTTPVSPLHPRIPPRPPALVARQVRAGGRIPLIIGRGLTTRARASLGLPPSDIFRSLGGAGETPLGYTLAQKMVGMACGKAGVLPGEYCEPKMTTVGSQDTTGPMTRDELKDLACLGFSADLVMQSFCHTAAYPKPVDVLTHHTLPDFIMNRGGVEGSSLLYRIDPATRYVRAPT